MESIRFCNMKQYNRDHLLSARVSTMIEYEDANIRSQYPGYQRLRSAKTLDELNQWLDICKWLLVCTRSTPLFFDVFNQTTPVPIVMYLPCLSLNPPPWGLSSSCDSQSKKHQSNALMHALCLYQSAIYPRPFLSIRIPEEEEEEEKKTWTIPLFLAESPVSSGCGGYTSSPWFVHREKRQNTVSHVFFMSVEEGLENQQIWKDRYDEFLACLAMPTRCFVVSEIERLHTFLDN